MTEEEEAIIANLKFETEQSAWYARVLAAVVEFKEVYGRLPALKTSPSESKSKAEQKLAQELATVRQARRRDIRRTRKAKGAQAVARRMLTAAEVEAWEAKLGNRIWVGTSATTDMYMPAADLKDDDKRHIFDRIPWCCEPVACYLCGYGVDSKESLIEHLKSDHYKGEDDLFTEERFFEEYRKRVFYYEETDGPFPVSGQEVRRAVSAHARHQTHSYPGTNKMNYEKPLKEGQGRSLGTCAICAMSAWQEELLQLWEDTHFTVLFVTHSIEEALIVGSRILVLSPHPGQVKAELNAHHLNHSNVSEPEFSELQAKIHNMLFADRILEDDLEGSNGAAT